MNLTHILLLIVDFGLVVLIWITQLIVYPGFQFIKEEYLHHWHRKYTFLIAIIVMPLMLAQLGLSIFALITDLNGIRIIALFLILGVWIHTFSVMIPIHNNIAQGNQVSQHVIKLVVANWFRTVCWSILFIIDLFAFLQ